MGRLQKPKQLSLGELETRVHTLCDELLPGGRDLRIDGAHAYNQSELVYIQMAKI